MRWNGYLATALALTALPAAAQVADPPPVERTDNASIQAWSERHLDLDGWVMIGSTAQGQSAMGWYLSEQSGPNSKYPLMEEWVRAEDARRPGSVLTRWEIDCAAGRSREVERVFYAGNNLRGSATLIADNQAARMAPAARGSINETVVQRACRDAR